MKKKHPWRQYDRVKEQMRVRHQLKGKQLPDDVAHIIDVHGFRHPLDMEGNTGLWRTA